MWAVAKRQRGELKTAMIIMHVQGLEPTPVPTPTPIPVLISALVPEPMPVPFLVLLGVLACSYFFWADGFLRPWHSCGRNHGLSLRFSTYSGRLCSAVMHVHETSAFSRDKVPD